MALKIQVVAWDRDRNVTGINRQENLKYFFIKNMQKKKQGIVVSYLDLIKFFQMISPSTIECKLRIYFDFRKPTRKTYTTVLSNNIDHLFISD
jgi:hypothetical protein